MTDLERLVAERACERLIQRFALCNDRKDFDALAVLFAEDGELARPFPPYRRCRGPAEIAAEMKATLVDVTVRHVCTNVLVEIEDDGTARGTTYFTVYRQEVPPPVEGPLRFAGVVYLGEYRDGFVRTPDGWRFARRDMTITHLVDPVIAR